MGKGVFCDCDDKKEAKANSWGVIDYKCNYSTFNGRRQTYSEYSQVACIECQHTWRTKAGYVEGLKQLIVVAFKWEFKSLGNE